MEERGRLWNASGRGSRLLKGGTRGGSLQRVRWAHTTLLLSFSAHGNADHDLLSNTDRGLYACRINAGFASLVEQSVEGDAPVCRRSIPRTRAASDNGRSHAGIFSGCSALVADTRGDGGSKVEGGRRPVRFLFSPLMSCFLAGLTLDSALLALSRPLKPSITKVEHAEIAVVLSRVLQGPSVGKKKDAGFKNPILDAAERRREMLALVLDKEWVSFREIEAEMDEVSLLVCRVSFDYADLCFDAAGEHIAAPLSSSPRLRLLLSSRARLESPSICPSGLAMRSRPGGKVAVRPGREGRDGCRAG